MNHLHELNDYQIDDLLLKALVQLKSTQREFDLIWNEKSRREAIRRQQSTHAEKGTKS